MKKKLVYGIGSVVLIALFAFGYYTISPLFRHIKVDEQVPVVMSEAKTNPAGVTGTAGHSASGTVSVLRGEKASYIRYENFKTVNGPDLYIYLANDLDAKDFVNLGTLKATEGNVNYEIPAGVDVGKYRYVMVWCKRFGVLFNYADISVTSTAKGRDQESSESGEAGK